MINLRGLFCFVLLTPLTAEASTWPANNEIGYASNLAITTTELEVEENKGESSIDPSAGTGVLIGGRIEYRISRYLSASGGLSLEHLRHRIKHSVSDGAFVAEFENTTWLLGVPLGGRLSPFAWESLYLPIYLTPKFALTDESKAVSCTGLCRSGSAMKSFLTFVEFGIGWSWSKWEAQLLFSQGLADQFEGATTDFRIRSTQLAVGYRW